MGYRLGQSKADTVLVTDKEGNIVEAYLPPLPATVYVPPLPAAVAAAVTGRSWLDQELIPGFPNKYLLFGVAGFTALMVLRPKRSGR